MQQQPLGVYKNAPMSSKRDDGVFALFNLENSLTCLFLDADTSRVEQATRKVVHVANCVAEGCCISPTMSKLKVSLTVSFLRQ